MQDRSAVIEAKVISTEILTDIVTLSLVEYIEDVSDRTVVPFGRPSDAIKRERRWEVHCVVCNTWDIYDGWVQVEDFADTHTHSCGGKKSTDPPTSGPTV